MKKIWKTILLILCVVGFMMACGKSVEAAWQEKLDLGQRYLEEENYEEAIVAFTEAIEIDPNRAEGYLGLAEVYIAMGDLENAIEWLETGYEKTSDESIQQKLSECILELAEKQREAEVLQKEEEESQLQNELAQLKDTGDELTDKMRLISGAESDSLGFLEGLEIIEYYPDKETYQIRLEISGGKGYIVPYAVIDSHGNVIVSGYEEYDSLCIWKTEKGYAKDTYYEKGTLEEASLELLYNILDNQDYAPVDEYVELYDWSGNFVERTEVDMESDSWWDDNPYPPVQEDYVSEWCRLGETFRSGDYSASEDTLDIERVEDGFIVRSKSGEEIGHIRVAKAERVQPIVIGNVLGLWEIYSYGCGRYYWVDIEE